MDGFVGREGELARLENLYHSGRFAACAIYGRRQIGKTTLMSVFSSGKRAVVFQFSNGSAYENLSHMGIVIGRFLGSDPLYFESLSEAMNQLETICRKEKTLVILDEIPYLVRAIPDAMSILQRFMDQNRDRTETVVLICGSSISMMKKETEDYDSPLYGRFPNRIELGPLSLKECMAFHRRMSAEDAVRIYLTVGGVPAYHRIMDDDSYESCIRKCFLGQDAPLSDEAAAVVEGELSPVDVHSGILACLADGKRYQNEIADALGISKSVCSRYIGNLKAAMMAGEVQPMLTAKKRPHIITDGLLAFSYVILRKYQPILKSDNTARTYGLMKKDIDTFLGRRFELLCRQYVSSSYQTVSIGLWWGRVDGEDTDIDVVAEIYNSNDLVITLAGECKFRNERAGVGVVHELERKIVSARAGPNVRMAVFSIGGFTEELAEYAQDHGVLLIGTDKLIGAAEPDSV